MSIKDARLSMCEGTAIGTSVAASVVLKGNYIDLGAQRDFYDGARTPNIGEAGNLWLNVKVTTAVTSSGSSAAVGIFLYHHTTASIASGAALISATGLAKGTMVAGYTVIRQKLPAGTINRYLGICTTIDSSALTAGAIDAWISVDGETPK